MSNAAKAKRIMEDVFHSGQIDAMNVNDIIDIREQLSNLWIQINGTEIVAGMTEAQVTDAIGPPLNTIGDIWYYPSTYYQYQYSIEFEAGTVKETDFVTLMIS
jgi:hypothetical protein